MVRLPYIAKVLRPSEIGLKGEDLAVNFLKRKGLRILARNYRFGRQEIDIIAEDRNTICFIEVKTRTNNNFGSPEEAITSEKKKHLVNLAISYIKRFNLVGRDVRFDVIAIRWNGKIPQVNYIKDAFIAENFYGI